MRFHTVLCVAVVVLLNLAGSFCQLDVCGRTSINTKITGGEDATAGSWPWQVSINQMSTQSQACGGSLINKDWVLSTTLCFIIYSNISDIVIYLGRQSQRGPNPHEISRTVLQIVTHPNFDLFNSNNDIALLQLSSSVNFTDYILPVCLAAAGSEFSEGLPSWVTGWGHTQSNTVPDMLQEVEISIVSNHNCNIAYDGLVTITENMLCAGLLNDGGNGLCAGDSGAPLVSRQGSRWIQSGIAIFLTCEENTYPAGFTRVSQYQDWITNHTVSDQPGFVKYNGGSTVVVPTLDPFLNGTLNGTLDPILDPISCIIDIFSGSSPSLPFFPFLSHSPSSLSSSVSFFKDCLSK